ncbi:hypothetical protein KFL_002550120 [Klebsormidium nitens]|uniref:Uncharacterized protein n=1 Tax=Klebsormidium nitens TaxID=105231 RepID=A0A1Y1I4E6_KLENI|nr:hypothetical protein KFL_002550120 [Klebsormidium nitens]|eukprot:GAQ85805.1 hypothetical protein KFL_002550120 [Klebsormidium nitens]
MAEEGDIAVSHDEQLSQKLGGNSGHIAALIVQRAFLSSRLRKARAERLGVEAIAERLVRADADLPRSYGSRRGLQLTNQLLSNSDRAHGVSKRAHGPPGSAWGTLLMQSQTRRVLFKRPGKMTDSRHLDAAQICRRLQTVAGPQLETCQAEEVVDSPRLADSPPTPTSDSRFSRASAAHQLTPYRPRRSSRTPPSLLQTQTQPQETAETDTVDVVRPELPSAEGYEEEVALERGDSAVAQASPAITIRHRPESSSTDRCSLNPRGAAEDPASATAPHAAPPSDVFESPTRYTTSVEDAAPPSESRLPAPADSGSPRVGLQGQSSSVFGLSPFPGGTPPPPSKLVAKAAKEMDAWRGEVQQMRAELSKTYRSICKLQSILWESPSARRLISPATLRQKRSPYRALHHAKLPPSPLSRNTLPQHGTSASLEPAVGSLSLHSKLDARDLKLRPEEESIRGSELGKIMHERLHSGANGAEVPSGEAVGDGASKRAGLVPGVFYLGTADGGVPAARSLDMGGANRAVPDPGVSEGEAPDQGSSDTGVSDRELPAQRRLFETAASVLGGRNGGPAGPQESEGEPHGRKDPSGKAGPRVYDFASWDEDATSGGRKNQGTRVGRGQAPGQGAPLGILGFLQGLFSPVGAAKKGREFEEATSVGGGEDEGAFWGSGSDEETGNGGRNASASGRTDHAAAAEPDTWHDASDEVLFEHTPTANSPSCSPRLSKTPPAEERATRPPNSPTSSPSRRRRTAVRSPVRSIAAVHLPPLTASYSTTPPALAPPAPLVFSPPRAPPQSSQSRNRVLVDRSHNESDEPVLLSKPEAWAAPPTPFRVDSENVPGNVGLSKESKSRIKRADGSRSVAERGLLSSFYRAGVGSRPLPPVTRDVPSQKASTAHSRPGLNFAAETRAAARNESTPVNGQVIGEAALEEGRHVKWWDAVEEEDKENGVAGKKPKERSPRYSPKHMSATPSKSILKQGVPVGPRSLAHARDIRLRKLQAQAALAPKLTGRALRIKGRYI